MVTGLFEKIAEIRQLIFIQGLLTRVSTPRRCLSRSNNIPPLPASGIGILRQASIRPANATSCQPMIIGYAFGSRI
jgi:hypothetical protein